MKRLKSRVPWLLAACFILGMAGSCQNREGTKTSEGSKSSESTGEASRLRPAPAFALKDPAGATHRLEDYRGKVILLHFWAGWCPPCVEEIGLWAKQAEAYSSEPVQFIAVSLDEKWPDALKIFPLKETKRNLVSLLDDSKKLPDQYGTYQFPETYLLTPDLKIVTKWVGPQAWDSEPIRKVIQAMLEKIKGKPGAGGQ